MYNQKIGRHGENIAARYLKQKGFKVLVRNFECKWGEIDLIALKDQRLHFVEVKTRTNLNKGRPEESLTWHKRQSFYRACHVFITSHGLADSRWQMDCLAILLDVVKNQAQVRYIPNISIDTRGHYSVR